MSASTQIESLGVLLRALLSRLLPGTRPEDLAPAGQLAAGLAAESMSPAEEALLARTAPGVGGRQAVDVVLEHRINAALRGEAERLAREGGFELPELPRVLVVRGGREPGQEHPGGDVLQVLSETRVVAPAPEAEAEAGGLDIRGAAVVLTDDGVFEELAGLRLDREKTSFVDESELARMKTADRPLTVVRSVHSLGALATLVRRALPIHPTEPGVAPPADHAERDLTGEVLSGKYRVKRLLGEGGFGSVYEAVDEMLGASVAIKVLTPKAAGRDEALEQFLDEAKLLTNLDHPSIVRWITFDRTPDGLHYFVMEYLEGEELSEILRRDGPLPVDRALAMLLEIVSALRAAHRLPDGGALYHLDLKPQNVFVVHGATERVKVIDFGISQHVGAEARTAAGIQEIARSDEPGHDLSQTITCAAPAQPAPVPGSAPPVRRARGGTLLYASPEQCKHLMGDQDIVELDGRSDLYSLGVMAFQMLTGELPYGRCDNPLQAIHAHQHAPPRKLSELSVRAPRGLSAFLERCLAKDREDRFRDAGEAHGFLDRVAHPPSRWPQFAAAGAVALVPLLWFLWPEPVPLPFDLVDVEDGRVILGPEAPGVSLDVRGRRIEPSAIRFVDDTEGGTELFTDWTAELADDGRIRIEAPPGKTTSERQDLFLELVGEEGSQFSSPLEVVYLGPGAWRLVEAGVPGLAGRALDPVGAELVVRIEGDREHLDEVRVALTGGDPLPAVRDGILSRGDDQRYSLPLSSFEGLATGTGEVVSFDVEAVDRAGGVRAARVELRLARDALRLEARLAGCISLGPDRYQVGRTSDPVLLLETNRPARTVWEVLDASGAPVDVRGEVVEDGERLVFPEAAEPFSGRIRITADDSATVLHAAPERGRDERFLEFTYETRAVELSASPRGARRGGHSGGSVSGGPTPWFTPDPALRVDVSRNDVQVSVQVRCTRASTGEVLTEELELHRASAGSVRFELAKDGVYTIEVQGFRYAGAGVDAPAEPEFTETFQVVLDRSAPELTATGLTAVLGPETLGGWSARLVVDDDVATPVELAWRLGTERGTLPRTAPGGGELELGWESLGLDPVRIADGEHELVVTATDLAGNEAREATLPLVVARRGPSVRFERPRDGAEWQSIGGNRFEVVAVVEDANGVARVACTARSSAGDQLVVSLAEDGDWKGTFTLPASWRDQDVTLACAAVDAHENAAPEETVGVRVGFFEPERPAVLEVFLASHPEAGASRMRLVAGAEGYLFGGRGDQVENATYRSYGLPVFDDTEPTRSWALDIRVEPFYLDENEVTVGEFRAFLLAGGGAVPRGERHAELLELLRERPADLPVTGVEQPEAAAYASWLGKRLPTAEEWECAVRGGFESRPFSAARLGAGPPSPDRFNVDVGFTGAGGAWPVTRGADVTPDGLRNLCSNVAEWTSTPGRREVGTFFAVGASFAHTAFDFTILSAKPATTRSASLGFRCALSAEDALALVESGGTGEVRARGLDAPGERRVEESGDPAVGGGS